MTRKERAARSRRLLGLDRSLRLLGLVPALWTTRDGNLWVDGDVYGGAAPCTVSATDGLELDGASNEGAVAAVRKYLSKKGRSR